MTSKFEYLLNAMECAAQEYRPADHDYAHKRKAVIDYVRDIEAGSSAGVPSGVPMAARCCTGFPVGSPGARAL